MFFEDICVRTDEALEDGLDPLMLAYLLLEASKQASMKGGPVPLYRHSYQMQNTGEEFRAEFKARFPHLDTNALMEGEIVLK